MISREEAIKKLQEYWGIEKFVFQAEFYIPSAITLREGSKIFGYFRNFCLNDEILDYPKNAIAKRKKNKHFPISLKWYNQKHIIRR
jgi:hypothetical protein